MGKVMAVCTSPKKGTAKQDVGTVNLISDWGIENDAHAGKWHRQVSLLSFEKIDDFRKKGADVDFGAFGENIVASGIDFRTLPIGTRFYCGDVILELTQIGKECHTHCEIYKRMGQCIMPREGVFTRVIQGGQISIGDEMTYVMPYKAAVVTISDSGFSGEREDLSGPAISSILEKNGYEVVNKTLIPDEQDTIEKCLCNICDNEDVQLIITTGGTGFSPRDVTPEATKAVIEKETPGIPEAMRYYSLQITPKAMLSRACAGIRKNTLIINLPGSPKACEECLNYILPSILHGIEIMIGKANNCSR